jgi:hypothetical protein
VRQTPSRFFIVIFVLLMSRLSLRRPETVEDRRAMGSRKPKRCDDKQRRFASNGDIRSEESNPIAQASASAIQGHVGIYDTLIRLPTMLTQDLRSMGSFGAIRTHNPRHPSS